MASRPRTLTEEPDTVGAAERRCGECNVKLSTYNPGPDCWQHTIGKPWQGPTAKPKP